MDKEKRTFRLLDMTMDCYQLERKVRDYKQMLDKATAIQTFSNAIQKVSNEYSAFWILEGVAENLYQKSVDRFENIKDFIKTLDAAYAEVPEEEEDE